MARAPRGLPAGGLLGFQGTDAGRGRGAGEQSGQHQGTYAVPFETTLLSPDEARGACALPGASWGGMET